MRKWVLGTNAGQEISIERGSCKGTSQGALWTRKLPSLHTSIVCYYRTFGFFSNTKISTTPNSEWTLLHYNIQASSTSWRTD